MLDSQNRSNLTYGKRQILVADDEIVNREILGAILQSEYEVLFACDGREAIDLVSAHKDTLSLVLLDILMPQISGIEVLKAMKADVETARIPVIVMTAERDTEVECLRLGAADFIPKPYPAVDVIHARVLRTIELSEDRETIQFTERDKLTGLFNREFFFRYALQMDQYNQNREMDAVLLDVSHFRMVNERYGKDYGDEVLRRIGEELSAVVKEPDGLACRREADTFLLYCPHREDYPEILKRITARFDETDQENGGIRLRMGVYSNVDRTLEIERCFDRAKMAADSVKETYTEAIGYYDQAMYEEELYAEQLVEAFPTALRERQFTVYYQPKFNIQSDTPLLVSAEALVRWNHPTLGMISPGTFIPLFERNGLIRQLDQYVWAEAARQIRDWRDRFGFAVPISVNMSRIDMFDPNLPAELQRILHEQDLTEKELLLEVTESAYTKDSGQIIAAAESLRKLGFRIEMDDFGTGYSALNLISSLPIDALKLDMEFIRDAFRDGGNTHMLEVIIGIAEYLTVPVIAEGVETEEQVHVLKALGCDIVQGYFFSKPVPAPEFEPFILQKKEADFVRQHKQAGLSADASEEDLRYRSEKLKRIRKDAEDVQEPAEPEELKEKRKGILLSRFTTAMAVLGVIAAAAAIILDIGVTRGYQRMAEASDRYVAAQSAAVDLETGSDYLTDRVQSFVVTGEIEYLNDYLEELQVTQRREKAVESLEEFLGDSDAKAVETLRVALNLSNGLVDNEYKAMRLVLESGNYDLDQVPEEIIGIELSESEKAASPEELRDTAEQLVFGKHYMDSKDRIRENVKLCTQALIHTSSAELEQSSDRLSFLVRVQTAVTVFFLLILLAIVVCISALVRVPLTRMVEKMEEQQPVVPTGVEELRIVSRVYNRILKDNNEVHERLSKEASQDALTGLLNRGAYDLLMENTGGDHIALLIIDVDDFKGVNDTYGHATGDRILKRVAELLRSNFRSVDILCRIGGDEFAVVMTRIDSSLKGLVLDKVQRMNDSLRHPKDDLPPVSLSVGIAFSDRENPIGDIFEDADSALYRVKEAGRGGCAVFGSEVRRY